MPKGIPAESPICSIEGCEHPHKARGWCRGHWERWRKTGDPEPDIPLRLKPRGTLERRFWAKVDKDGPLLRPDLGACWIWLAYINPNGYAQIGRGGARGGNMLGHRLAYELLVGPVPEGLDLDHLCRNRACVNPEHLEPVTRRENLLRGETLPADQVKRTHCKHGHPYDETNTAIHGGKRYCRACQRRSNREQYLKRKARRAARAT